ncbi:MAG: tRNA uridine-5-carboxymethylaminomethyl(34) synthesis GTPase MnmE [Gammaproteobacteria bacterium]|jgi:tRNA modification GTPase|nr:tRNA uridine-5-carboxymethylaminomethyl(34) synthesis GTPase MnmE [Gammaproteobacteria bacterium]
MIDNRDTIAAIATPPGRGGIGVIRISGPLAQTICTSITGKTPVVRQVNYCSFNDSQGITLDRGVVLYFSSPASYTGEDVVELQGHGGQAVQNMVLNRTLELGARLARPGEFTERAFINDKLDLLQAEAVADLIESSSEQAVRSAMRSLDGEFSSRINSLLKNLIEVRVFIEGALDFPEEEIDFLSGSDIAERVKSCQSQLEIILLKACNGRVLREGISVAIVGPPNVGKSSLLNALSKTNRAIVTSSPGTTRDVIEEKILLEGIYLNIIDTAGIRETEDNIEKEGIRRAQIAAEKADLLIVVNEAKRESKSNEAAFEFPVSDKTTCIMVQNKIDLAGMDAQISNKDAHSSEVYISVKTGEGMELLIGMIKKAAGFTSTTEDVFSARTRHVEALSQANSILFKTIEEFKSKKPAAELIAEDLLQAQKKLETITGESTPDDLLGEIFSSFCIGK